MASGQCWSKIVKARIDRARTQGKKSFSDRAEDGKGDQEQQHKAAQDSLTI